MNDPTGRWPEHKEYTVPGAESQPSFGDPASDHHIREAVLRLTSAAIASDMDLPPRDLPSLVRRLRLALT